MISRRAFFTRTAVLSGGAVSFPFIGRAAEASLSAGQKPARIIHMVADGMSMGTLTGADYLSQHLRNKGLTWLRVSRESSSHLGLVNMRSLNSMVTDSSAASSSWGSGSRVKNGALNCLPDGRKLKTLCGLFGEIGWKRGLVTTTEITHATPAGFATCVPSRGSTDLISAQYLDGKIDVLLGGGRKLFNAAGRSDKRFLRGEFSQAGYEVMDTAAELSAASVDRRWLGLFSDSHLPFSIDQRSNARFQTHVPTLAFMTRRALDWLERHDHFILQVEGGRVDHAAHNCDAPAALGEMIAFDEAIDVVVAFQKEHPDTLVVITTDHGNGNMGVNGAGNEYEQSFPMFKRIAGVKCSFPEILWRLRRKPAESTAIVADVTNSKVGTLTNSLATVAATNQTATAAAKKAKDYVPGIKEIQDILADAVGYTVSDRRAQWFQNYLAKKGDSVYELMNSDVVQLGQLLGNHIAVGWTGNVHTADFVTLTALGPGSGRFSGFIQNVDVFRHYTQLAGIDFKNPESPLIAENGWSSKRVENLDEYALV
jgi:alkaline phosphatase